MTDDLIDITDGENKGGKVYPTSSRLVPVGRAGENTEWLPWHQGREPQWSVDANNYAEYVNWNGNGDPQFSLFTTGMRGAYRTPVTLVTEQWNERREHGWKGYDEITGNMVTAIGFNGIQVFEVHGWSNNLMRHLVQVAVTVEQLLGLPRFGWWSSPEIQKVWGYQVQYKGLPATIRDSWHVLGQGSVMLHVPDWPKDDDYWTDGVVKTSLLDPQIN